VKILVNPVYYNLSVSVGDEVAIQNHLSFDLGPQERSFFTYTDAPIVSDLEQIEKVIVPLKIRNLSNPNKVDEDTPIDMNIKNEFNEDTDEETENDEVKEEDMEMEDEEVQIRT